MSSSKRPKSAIAKGKMKADPAPSEGKRPAWYLEHGWHFDEANNHDFVDKNGMPYALIMSNYYEYVHEKIKAFIQKRLWKYYGFAKLPIPPTKGGNLKTCANIFASPDVLVNSNILVLIQGLGRVYPGVWARKLFTNGRADNFKHATQFPYIRKAFSYGWAVVICDPNGDGSSEGSRARHIRRVWEDVIKRSVASNVMIVAFSAGTRAALSILDLENGNEVKKDFMKRVQALVLLDGAIDHAGHNEWLAGRTRAMSRHSEAAESRFDGKYEIRKLAYS
ncbi:hypothetical protein EC991_010999 [Linnemannia zychae]|nr:hypothetical protein EC991_010999 [Linnemannia zychae]